MSLEKIDGLNLVNQVMNSTNSTGNTIREVREGLSKLKDTVSNKLLNNIDNEPNDKVQIEGKNISVVSMDLSSLNKVGKIVNFDC